MLKKKRTSIVLNENPTKDPTFNETLNFDLPPNHVESMSFIVSVYSKLPQVNVIIILVIENETFVVLKYLSPVGSMIKFLVTNFWILGNIKHYNHTTFMNQQVVTENSIIEPTALQ